MINRVVLVGRMANDPELKYTPSGVAVANFRVAVDRNRPSQQGEREVDFIPVVAWRQNAEFAANYMNKGRVVAIEGRIQVRSWQTQDGQRRRTVEVLADRVQGIGRRESSGEAPAPAEAPGQEEPEDLGPMPDDPFPE
jgi:single-strand DNA-binding protein